MLFAGQLEKIFNSFRQLRPSSGTAATASAPVAGGKGLARPVPPPLGPLLRGFFGCDSSRPVALAPKMKAWRGRCRLPEGVRALPPP